MKKHTVSAIRLKAPLGGVFPRVTPGLSVHISFVFFRRLVSMSAVLIVINKQAIDGSGGLENSDGDSIDDRLTGTSDA